MHHTIHISMSYRNWMHHLPTCTHLCIYMYSSDQCRIWVVPCRSVHAQRKNAYDFFEKNSLIVMTRFFITLILFRMYSQFSFCKQNLTQPNECRWCKSNLKACLDLLHWQTVCTKSPYVWLYLSSFSDTSAACLDKHYQTVLHKPLHLSLFCFQSATLYFFWLSKNKQISTKSFWSKQHPSW